ncbi:hypothetical protein MY04_2613 [Flammeovirga sp. MY04]|uniref:hypothetical protein n=1 Tax=Flammeovirga sp. MY04 TaxID=1191459 RepID=UPI0008061506|nr:hypothetical protein [Flammeovirga sp. MY04]ANQ49982.1 hypothetical protein MY04_2613 [Flammeovirga sp. MY04]
MLLFTRVGTLCTFLFLSYSLFSQTPRPSLGNIPLGASSQAKGNQHLFSDDVWGSFNDLSSILLSTSEVGVTHRSIFQEVAYSAIGVVHPIHSDWSTSIGIQSIGDSYLSEQSIDLGSVHQIGIIRLGGGISYNQLRAEGVNTLQLITFNFAVRTKLSSKVSLGVGMKNVGQSMYKEGIFGADKSSLLAFGFHYQINSFFKFSTSFERDKYQPLQFKSGFEYQWKKYLFLRGGVQMFPFDISLGSGFHHKKWKVDYAFSSDDVFAWSHQFSICYVIRKLKS